MKVFPPLLNRWPSLVFLFRALITLGWVGVAPLAQAADWPQFLGPSRDGRSADDVSTNWPSEGPVRLWQKPVGQGFSGPVIAGGRLILFHRQGSEEIVECLNATNGAVYWTNKYPTHYQDDFGFDEGPRATPSIYDGRVVTLGAEGMLSAWKVQNGQRLWQVDTRKEFKAAKGFFGIAGSPVVDQGRVIANVGGREGAGLVAFDVASGKELWKTGNEEASYASPVVTKIGERRYGLAVTRGTLTAFDPEKGTIYFRYPFRPPISASVSAATPLVIGDLIFLTASYGTGAALLRFDETKPVQLWAKDDILSSHYATPVHHAGFLYGFDGRQEERCNLRCIELAKGRVRWSQDHFGAGTLILAKNALLILSEGGELIQAALSPDAFHPLNRTQILGFEARAHPALADGRFYARSKNQLVCVDLTQNHGR